MPAVVRNANIAANPAKLVADAAGSDVAVHGAVPGEDPVDGLEDVDLAALRPGRAVPDRVTE